ncbi:hypothetical protein JMJ35_008942 [Cladonia borealis]|uniref:Uncharacterized protein n=1 Tax=Cladonia borealis TaxID=184061 RepID=A0AA39QUI6_9LECA|nr:hypothetical protein JMJ35_008942 [Cladonia borealis]
MIPLPRDARTQEPSDPSSDYQSQIPLLAGRRNSYRVQQDEIGDPPSYDATIFQEDARQRSLNDNGYSRHPTVSGPSFPHYEADINSNPGSPEIAKTGVQSMPPSPGVSLNPRPPKAVLRRGLQIPTRISFITSGFHLPPTLCDAGVDRARWKAFTREVKGYGSMSKSQWANVLGCSFAVGLVIDSFILPGAGGLVVAPVLTHKRRRNKERENFRVAFDSGGLQLVAEKWNRELFEPLGLQVRIEPPNHFRAKDMKTMDVSSTKLFKYQEKKGLWSSSTGGLSESADKKEMKYAGKEWKYRTKAARKGRILIFPMEPEIIQAEDDEPAAVSSKGYVGQRDGGGISRTWHSQESGGPGTEYTSLPAAGSLNVLQTVQLCAAATGVAVHLQALT